MCAILASMTAFEAGNAAPSPLAVPDAADARIASKSDPMILASNVEFQRTVQTQTELIRREAAERRRKIAQEHLEQKTQEMKKKVR